MDKLEKQEKHSDRNRWRRPGAKGALLLAVAALAVALPERAEADMTLLKMGWTYTIGFPEALADPQNSRWGITSGTNTYRVLASGGAGWYRLQRVQRHPNGGWVSPPGTPLVWVNMGYAYVIRELQGPP